jgi:3-hydroxyisobutyrate dehydrogenase-like beta-hydroxyacid dehydrogenase
VKVGFIGLGLMGAPMAANLARAGVDLCVWNRTVDKTQTLVRNVSCAVADSPVELARRSDVVITMVADGNVLDGLYDDAVLDALGPGGIAVDMSTIGPVAARTTAARLAERGVRFVDAPVSGSTAAATSGELMIFVGATPEDFAAVSELLGHLGKEVVHIGGPGHGALIKLAINNMVYGLMGCVAEALLLAERGGLDRVAAYDAFLKSVAAAPVMHYRREAFLEPDDTPVAFTLRLVEKDMRLTVELADDVGAPMQQARLNRDVVIRAIEAGYGEHDLAGIAEYLRSLGVRA